MTPRKDQQSCWATLRSLSRDISVKRRSFEEREPQACERAKEEEEAPAFSYPPWAWTQVAQARFSWADWHHVSEVQCLRATLEPWLGGCSSRPPAWPGKTNPSSVDCWCFSFPPRSPGVHGIVNAHIRFCLLTAPSVLDEE